MSKKTMFDTRFWSDSFVSDLDPIEKLLFNYVLTNSHISMCGIYELPIKVMALETGIEREMLLKILARLEKSNKIVYQNGWLCVVNYPKHQNYNKTTMVKALTREIGLIPAVLLETFVKIGYPIDTLCLGYKDKEQDKDKDMTFANRKKYSEERGYEEDGIQTDPDFTPEKKQKKAADEIQQVFDLFSNPARHVWRLREIERESARVLHDTYGIETLTKRIARIEKEKKAGDPYFPEVNSPSQLLEKMPNVERYLGL